ncbi:3-dehydroquinate synthase [Lacihabitans sp. LS3-19]|uniref:3-dehydroquinate synthase n=1 Tax=Lacihabitans sp. LS3-19 TaxID=2487335 RepID=UPI0020CBEC62|nr:3-dehydroquinate synthase [Lacihabitans sp. LS3-19]MCP9769487.1 3-dehydroquinate synthase [Lacihabitans sp. LS3-19]
MSVVISPIADSLSQFFAQNTYSKVMVLVDNNTKKHCYPLVKSSLPAHKLIVIKSGEQHKTLDTCQQIWEEMTMNSLDRHALIVNLGGGVIGDMGGFCAATYKRGIDFIQIPTTLLSQVDASVGGKLGVDFQGYKNHIGVFTLPKTVFIDEQFLKTLPANELRSGFAEIIKHCLIRDKAKWNEIKVKDLENQDLADLISHSVEIKKQIVAEDPTEKGLRKILNFGHTIGHAIETFYLDKGKQRLLHGEAIAAGMIAEAYISFTKKMISEATLLEIEEFIFAVYGNVYIDELDFVKIVNLTLQDKKNKGNLVRASLLDGIGTCQYDISITKGEMIKALNYYCGF